MTKATTNHRPSYLNRLPALVLLAASTVLAGDTLASDGPDILTTYAFTTGRYFSPSNILNGQGAIDITGPGLVDGGATLFSLAAAPGADAHTYPSTATWYVGTLASSPWASRLSNAGITSTALSYGSGSYLPGHTNDLLGFSQVGNTLTIVLFSYDNYGNTFDRSTPQGQVTYTLTSPTAYNPTLVSSFQVGTYASPTNILGGTAKLNVAGSGTQWSLATASGANSSTYPSTASWFVGLPTSTPLASRLNNAGITSTALSYGTGSYLNGHTADLLGFAQVGNTLAIILFSYDNYGNTFDRSAPQGQITYTVVNSAAATVTYVLPSSAYSFGAGGAEFHTDLRVMNAGEAQVTVTPKFYDQSTGQAYPASSFVVPARNQASFDNVLQSLFGRDLGSYGPIRLEATGPLIVSSSVNNVNACGSGAVSGQWLPGIDTSKALTAGLLVQLGLSANPGAGYRSNVVFMNPGSLAATVSVSLRRGGGSLVGSSTIGPLAANGFQQISLSSLPGTGGLTDTNLYLEFTSDQPVLSFASVVNNGSGDPFAIVASPDVSR